MATISITQSNSTTDGYLSSTDWNTFNNKVSSDITGIPGAIQVVNSVIISQTNYNNLSSIDPNTTYYIIN